MKPRTRLVLVVTSTLAVGYIAVGALLGRVLGDSTYGQLSVFNEVIRIVMDSYVEPVDLDRAMAGARVGLTDALDGDSAYLNADDFKAYQAGVRPEGDVGVSLTRRFAFLAVASVRPGSAAERGGLKVGDIIKTLDGHHTRPLSAAIGQRLLRGAPGTEVKLTVLRANSDPVDLTITRERPGNPLPISARSAAAGVGYVKVPEITARTPEELRFTLESQRRGGARSLVLDLRGTGWGDPADGAAVANLFVRQGVLSRLAGSHVPERTVEAQPGKAVWDEPLVVLVDLGTSGPGEVAAAALQDSGRATLVGSHTFGRAAIQKPVPLYEGGLLLTVATYRTPKGQPLHGKGLEPGVAVAVDSDGTRDQQPEGSPADPVLEKALEVLKNPPAAKKAA